MSSLEWALMINATVQAVATTIKLVAMMRRRR